MMCTNTCLHNYYILIDRARVFKAPIGLVTCTKFYLKYIHSSYTCRLNKSNCLAQLMLKGCCIYRIGPLKRHDGTKPSRLRSIIYVFVKHMLVREIYFCWKTICLENRYVGILRSSKHIDWTRIRNLIFVQGKRIKFINLYACNGDN